MDKHELLKYMREEHKLSQEELAQKLGKSQKTISAWETGKSYPLLGEIFKMAEIYECSVEQLTGTEKRKTGDITIEDIYAKMQDLEVKELESIIFRAEKAIQNIREKDEMLARIQEYERKIKDLQRRIDNA